ncbi:hypothetical protein AX660_14985 [Paraglaciecola hydrolytica]|uniref:Peptidase A2 domain-containing protein n=2 Tax=Paraglaciecola hydrolytica TaxID=1799789 RepID=A0A136A2H9_9ALTE|nr:hypothetical protein AX660_14985 [Paraglaciecola hydrolytica]
MRGHPLLWLICLVSVTLNVYLIYGMTSASKPYTPPKNQASPAGNQTPANHNLAPDENVLSHQNDNITTLTAQRKSVPQNDNRSDLLAQAASLLLEEDYTELRLLLRDYLQQHPLDMDFLLLEAQLNVKTELLSDAIAHYYSLTKLPMSAAQYQEIHNRISELSGQTISQLQRAYSWDTLAIFVEPLLQLEPQNRSYILALAEAYAQQNQFNLMENILASLDFDDPASERIRQLNLTASSANEYGGDDSMSADSTAHKAANMSIKLLQIGDQYIVNGLLSGNNVALLIDTGASITALSRQYFNGLSNRHKVNFVGRFSVNTASGPVLAPMYQFSELKLNHAVVENISVVVLPMRNIDNVNGLLGMNFLREFDFKIDQRKSQLLLKR